MYKLASALVALLVPSMAFAFAPVESVAAPTMSEAALLALSVVMPAFGVLALRHRNKAGQR